MAELMVGSAGGFDFAVRADRVIETASVGSFSRFMRNGREDVVAAVIDEKVVFLSDPSVGLGLAEPGQRGSAALIISARHQIAGLLCDTAPQKLGMDDSELLPVSSIVSGAPFSECFRFGGRYVGVFSEEFLSGLEDGVLQTASLKLGETPGKDPARELIELSAGGRSIAVAAGSITGLHAPLDATVPLSSQEPYLTRLAAYEGVMVPVVDMALLLGRPSGGTSHPVVWTSGHATVLLTTDGSAALESQTPVLPLPRLLSQPATSSAVLHRERAVPVADIGLLLTGARSEESAYLPASTFGSRVLIEPISVVELRYGPFVYAVPESEVSETLEQTLAYQLRSDHPLADSVLELEEELIPVLNLGRYLGSRNQQEPAAQTLVVSNGTFRAAVRPEELLGTRSLPVEQQRPLPIEMPHGVLYGCYVDGTDVRLILNLAAIAQHARDDALQSAFASFGVANESATASAADGGGREPSPVQDQADGAVDDVAAPAHEETLDGAGSAVESSPRPSPGPSLDLEVPPAKGAPSPDVHPSGDDSTSGEDQPSAGVEPGEPETEPVPEEEPVFAPALELQSGSDFTVPEENPEQEAATRQEPAGDTPDTAAASAATVPEEQPQPTETRRKRGRWLLVAVPLLLVLAVGGVYIFTPTLRDRLVTQARNIGSGVVVGAEDQGETPGPEMESEPAGGDEPSLAQTETQTRTEPQTQSQSGSQPQTQPLTLSLDERLYFAADSSELLPPARVALAELVQEMEDPAEWRIEIVGHTARAGTPESSLRLSEQRAFAVRDYLLELLEKSPAGINARGVGSAQPAASNASDAGMAQNRRVELTAVAGDS